MTRLPEPLAFASEARTAFWLLILYLVGYVALMHPDDPYLALFAVVFSVIWYLNQRGLRRKYLEKAATNAGMDENAVLLLAKSRKVPLERVVYTRDIRDSRALSFIDRNAVTLVLGGLFRILRHRAPAIANGVIFHEFGHITNRDIRITQVARTIVATTLVLMPWDAVSNLIGFHQLFLTQHAGLYQREGTGLVKSWLMNWSPVLRSGLLPFVVPLVMTIIYKQFLRDREYAADRVSSNLGGSEGLVQTFTQGTAKTSFSPHPFASHPRPGRRAATVVNLAAYRLPSPTTLGLLGYLTGFGASMSILISLGVERSGPRIIALFADVLLLIIVVVAISAAANHLERSFSLSAFVKASRSHLLARTAAGSLCFFVGLCLAESWLGPLIYHFANDEAFRRASVESYPLFVFFSAFFISLALPVQSMATAMIMRYTEGPVRPKITLAIVRVCTFFAASAVLAGLCFEAFRRDLFPKFFTYGYTALVGEALKEGEGTFAAFFGQWLQYSVNAPLFYFLAHALFVLGIAALWVFVLYRGRRASRRNADLAEEERSWPEWMVRPMTIGNSPASPGTPG